MVNVVPILYQNYQDTVLNRSRNLYLPVVLACSLTTTLIFGKMPDLMDLVQGVTFFHGFDQLGSAPSTT